MQSIHEALTQTLADSGGTFDARTLDPIAGGPWAVGGGLPGIAIPIVTPWPEPLVVAFGDAYNSLLEDGAQVIGTWIDEGTLYVDAIDLIVDTDAAIRLASERGERAIYHLTDKITLEVSRQ